MRESDWSSDVCSSDLIAVCGRNTAFKEHLEQNIKPKIANPALFKMDVLGFTQAEDMADLTHMAHVVIGKPGGITMAEVIHSGARFLGDQTGYRLTWEKLNNAIATDVGVGDKIEHLVDLIPKLAIELAKPRIKANLFPQDASYSDNFTSMMAGLIQEAEQDEEYVQQRTSWQPHVRAYQPILV